MALTQLPVRMQLGGFPMFPPGMGPRMGMPRGGMGQVRRPPPRRDGDEGGRRAPTPFSLAEGTAHHFTLILPADAAIDDDLIEVGYLVRKEVDKVVVAYSFDLRTNEMATKLIDNPNAGCEHHFKAYRMNGDPPDRVQLQERSRLKFEATLLGNEKEGGNDE